MQFSKIWFNHYIIKGFPNIAHHLPRKTFLFAIQLSFMVYLYSYMHYSLNWRLQILPRRKSLSKRNSFYKFVNLPGLYFLMEMHIEKKNCLLWIRHWVRCFNPTGIIFQAMRSKRRMYTYIVRVIFY